MKWRWFRISVTVFTILLAVIGLDVWRENAAQARRQEQYQKALEDYRAALRDSTTRRQVEAFLQKRGAQIEHYSGIDNEQSAGSDLVHIGDDPKPWYCSENRVYIAFTFGSSEGPHPRYATDSPDDQLTGIRIFHMLGGCL